MKNISFCIAHKILALLLVVATLFQASYADESVSIDLDAEYINEFYVIQNQHPPHPDTPLMEQAYRPESLTLESDRDATDVILRRSDTLLTHVERLPGAPEMKELRRRQDQL